MSPATTIPTARPGPQSWGLNPVVFSLAPQVVFTKNHQKLALPQHMTVTCVGTISARLVSPYVTFDIVQFARVLEFPIRAARIRTFLAGGSGWYRAARRLAAGMGARPLGNWWAKPHPTRGQKPRKCHVTATRDRRRTWQRPARPCVTLCHFAKLRSWAIVSAMESKFAVSDGTCPRARVFYMADSGRKRLI